MDFDQINYDISFSSLDPSQKRALDEIAGDDTSSIHIVYGPPGTGKSQLVVSLLERLAVEHKKVLFVSQNTEALRVIERMIRKTEKDIGYPTDESHFSLLDMCLMLYEPAQRKLKYLREHSSVVRGKHIRMAKHIEKPASISYALQYTQLNHDDNYNIDSNEIGFDELMAYYLKYVTFDLAPEVLSEFENVNVRKIFNLIDNYEQRESFSDFTHPRRELYLLATNNSELNLPIVREQVKKIKDTIIDKNTGDYLIPAKETMDVVDYIDLLLIYADLAKAINIYSLSTSPNGLKGLLDDLEQVVAQKSKHESEISELTRQLDSARRSSKYTVNGLSLDTPAIELPLAIMRAAEQDLDRTLSDLEDISDVVKEINSFAKGFKYSSPQELQINLAKAVAAEYRQTIDFINENEASNLLTLSAAEIHQLHDDLHAYFAISGPKKLLRRIPESFIALDLKNNQWMECYRDDILPVFDKIVTVLDSTKQNFQWIIELADQKSTHSLAKLGVNYQSADELIHLFLTSSRLYLLLEKYDLAKLNYDELTKVTQSAYSSLKTLQELWLDEDNGRLIFQHGLKQFLTEVEKKHQVLLLESEIDQNQHEYEQQLSKQYATCSKLLKEVNSSLELAELAQNIITQVTPYKTKFETMVAKLEIPITDAKLDTNYLSRSRSTLLEVSNSNCLSDFAFEIEHGKNLETWVDKILCLEQYSNDAEIASFVEHNNFIEAIYANFGEANHKYLAEVLEQDGLTYQKFAARLVSVLVREVYGRSPINARRRVDNDSEFFKQYATYLKSQKALRYARGLRMMYEDCASAMKELARYETMCDATKSTFEKFRMNTAKILEAFPIVCATPKEVAKYLAPEPGEFDYVIFDEASQLLPGQALPSIFRAKKAVIIGDPHQMPPALNLGFGAIESNSEDDEEDIGESILDLARKQPQRQHHLKVHYRSRYNKLFEPSCTAIYASEGIKPIFEAEPSRRAPIAIEDNLGNDNAANFERICSSAGEYLATIENPEDESGALFCILFARGEVLAEFRRYLAEDETCRKFNNIIQLYNQDKILLSTVTNCQGIEGLYTIIYLQYYSSPASMWFFKEGAGAYKRLNVSITRQREGLKLLLANPQSAWIMACDSKINNPKTGPNARLSAELMKSLLENAGEATDFLYLERTLGDNINYCDSPLTEQLYQRLVSHYGNQIGKTLKIYSEVGWNLLVPNGDGIDQNERNVGFRIDLGVYSIEKKKFILGIEMDGATYHTGYYKEHSDYNRQQVLEAKGWTLYRIWSTNWLNDEAREFDRLVNKIDEML